jgi:hypothetical protein
VVVRQLPRRTPRELRHQLSQLPSRHRAELLASTRAVT